MKEIYKRNKKRRGRSRYLLSSWESRWKICYCQRGGGSVGARMAAWLGSYGTAVFGEAVYPQANAVIMQYMGL